MIYTNLALYIYILSKNYIFSSATQLISLHVHLNPIIKYIFNNIIPNSKK